MLHEEIVDFPISPLEGDLRVRPSLLGTELKISGVSQDSKARSNYSPVGPGEATSILAFSRPDHPSYTC